MTTPQLYEKLKSKEFQNTDSLFYNAYIFEYDIKEEYSIRQQITEIKESLKRPATYVDVLALNIFDEFCEYLKQQPFGKLAPNLLEHVLNLDTNRVASTEKLLAIHAGKDEFLKFIHDKIIAFQDEQTDDVKPYVFLYGFSQMYPYIRANTFLSLFEKYNRVGKYNMIIFYPGHTQNNSFSLFGVLDDAHTYRSIKLIND